MLVLSCSFAVNCPTSPSCGAVAGGTAGADQITPLLDVIFDFLLFLFLCLGHIPGLGVNNKILKS